MPQVCQLDSKGFFVGFAEADESPLEPGVLLIPGGCVEAVPPVVPVGSKAHWNGSAWEYFDAQDVGPITDAIDSNGVLSVEARLRAYTDAIQTRLDAFAATRGYNSILSACSYATSSVPRFAAEGQYCVELRDQTWLQCYAILDAVTAGERPAPTLDKLLAELPQPQWPATPASPAA